MDSHELVIEQIDAATELVERFDRFMPVSAAFWLKLAGEASWSLYIAADRVKQEGVATGNREIVRICQDLNSPYLDMFQVRLITDDHPLARAVLDVHRRYPGKLPIRFGGKFLGDIAIDGAYLYAAPLATAHP